MQWFKFIALPILGLLSALTVNFLLFTLKWSTYGQHDWFIGSSVLGQVTPGFIFGIFILFWMILFRYYSVKKYILWLIVSTLAYVGSYYIAFWSIVKTLNTNLATDTITPSFGAVLISFFIAGLFGGFSLTYMFGKIVPLYKHSIIYISIIAGLLAFGWQLLGLADNMQFNSAFSSLYLLWQTGVALSLAIATKESVNMRNVAKPTSRVI